MPKAQSEITFNRENITGYQSIINLHPSFLPGEGSGFDKQVCGLQHNRNLKCFFAIKRAVISTYLYFIDVDTGTGSLSCFVHFRFVPVSISPNLFIYMFFFPSSLSPINWPYSLASLLPSCPLKPLYRGCSFVVKIWNLELHLLQHRPPLCVHQMYRIDFAFIFCMPKYFIYKS